MSLTKYSRRTTFSAAPSDHWSKLILEKNYVDDQSKCGCFKEFPPEEASLLRQSEVMLGDLLCNCSDSCSGRFFSENCYQKNCTIFQIDPSESHGEWFRISTSPENTLQRKLLNLTSAALLAYLLRSFSGEQLLSSVLGQVLLPRVNSFFCSSIVAS